MSVDHRAVLCFHVSVWVCVGINGWSVGPFETKRRWWWRHLSRRFSINFPSVCTACIYWEMADTCGILFIRTVSSDIVTIETSGGHLEFSRGSWMGCETKKHLSVLTPTYLSVCTYLLSSVCPSLSSHIPFSCRCTMKRKYITLSPQCNDTGWEFLGLKRLRTVDIDRCYHLLDVQSFAFLFSVCAVKWNLLVLKSWCFTCEVWMFLMQDLL